METIEFWKMSGSGNDFILIDNREGLVAEKDMGRLALKACRRRESVGADGMIFVIPSAKYDFAWRFYNADGGEAEMCGNGGRCVARFAFLKGIAGRAMTFDTIAGPITAEVSDRIVKVLMPVPTGLKRDIDLTFQPGWVSADFINTGVPHVVIQVNNLEDHPIVEHGRFIRYHSMFSPEGTNANFIDVKGSDYIKVRTYERGVEDETLACGTGAMGSVLIANMKGLVSSPVRVATRGGEELKIYFNRDGDSFDKVWLEGSTAIIYEGQLHEEAL